jgi:hypothetical protein
MITTEQLITAYAEFVARQVNEGWTASLLTFTFHELPGSPAAVARQMERDLERIYATLVSRVVRNPASRHQVGKLPVWICSPDYPVFKREKQKLSDVTINDGRHVHGTGLMPPKSRLKEGLEDHIAAHRNLYIRPPFPILEIDVQPITHDLRRAVDYTLKGLRRGTGSTLILPRSWTEMPD